MDNVNYSPNQGAPAAQPRSAERYDPIRHIDELIEILREASGVPFSDKCSVDRGEMIASLEELKNRLPASVAQSNDIVMRAQEIIGTAREKNKKIVDDANRMYASKVNDHEITRGARDEAENIIMAAEQAVKLTDRKVCVLQTRTIPQGIAAMLAFDDSLSLSDNRINMTKAFEKVQTGLVTFAARDSEFEGHAIKEGEILALENGKLSFTEKDINKATYKLVKKLAKGDANYVTLIHGADVPEENAEQLQQFIQNKFGDKLEVMVVNGGQPVYYYIISVE